MSQWMLTASEWVLCCLRFAENEANYFWPSLLWDLFLSKPRKPVTGCIALLTSYFSGTCTTVTSYILNHNISYQYFRVNHQSTYQHTVCNNMYIFHPKNQHPESTTLPETNSLHLPGSYLETQQHKKLVFQPSHFSGATNMYHFQCND